MAGLTAAHSVGHLGRGWAAWTGRLSVDSTVLQTADLTALARVESWAIQTVDSMERSRAVWLADLTADSWVQRTADRLAQNLVASTVHSMAVRRGTPKAVLWAWRKVAPKEKQRVGSTAP